MDPHRQRDGDRAGEEDAEEDRSQGREAEDDDHEDARLAGQNPVPIHSRLGGSEILADHRFEGGLHRAAVLLAFRLYERPPFGVLLGLIEDDETIDQIGEGFPFGHQIVEILLIRFVAPDGLLICGGIVVEGLPEAAYRLPRRVPRGALILNHVLDRQEDPQHGTVHIGEVGDRHRLVRVQIMIRVGEPPDARDSDAADGRAEEGDGQKAYNQLQPDLHAFPPGDRIDDTASPESLGYWMRLSRTADHS